MISPTHAGRRDAGNALILVLGYLAVVTVLGSGFFVSVHRTIAASQTQERHTVCVYLAEAGVEKALAEVLRQTPNYTGETETALGDGFYSVSVEGEPASDAFTVVATSRLGDTETTLAKARIRADVRTAAGHVVSLRWTEERIR